MPLSLRPARASWRGPPGVRPRPCLAALPLVWPPLAGAVLPVAVPSLRCRLVSVLGGACAAAVFVRPVPCFLSLAARLVALSRWLSCRPREPALRLMQLFEKSK